MVRVQDATTADAARHAALPARRRGREQRAPVPRADAAERVHRERRAAARRRRRCCRVSRRPCLWRRRSRRRRWRRRRSRVVEEERDDARERLGLWRPLLRRRRDAPHCVAQQGLGEQHLAAAQRAAPARVGRQRRPSDRRKAAAVRQPRARGDVAQRRRLELWCYRVGWFEEGFSMRLRGGSSCQLFARHRQQNAPMLRRIVCRCSRRRPNTTCYRERTSGVSHASPVSWQRTP